MTAGALLGEGPLWDSARRVLWWVDILAGDLHCYTPETGADHRVHVGTMASAVVPRSDGTLLLARERDLAVFDPESGAVVPQAFPHTLPEGVRFNDGKCDAGGRFWIGSMALDAAPERGSLYCLYPDGRCECRLDAVTISNGLAWDDAGQTFYFIDTATHAVVAYDFDARSGEITNRRSVIGDLEERGVPDGMSIDSEGMLWVAHWGGWCVRRWDPHSGRCLAEVRLPTAQVSSCCFGGQELDTLYITTARNGLDRTALASQPLAGALFRYRPDSRGTMPHRFGR